MHKKINSCQKYRFCVIFVTFNDAILDAFALGKIWETLILLIN